MNESSKNIVTCLDGFRIKIKLDTAVLDYFDQCMLFDITFISQLCNGIVILSNRD